MKNKFFKQKRGQADDFKTKVERIMRDEKDFSSLYDYKKISSMTEKEEIDYLCNLTKKYIEMKQQIIKEKLA